MSEHHEEHITPIKTYFIIFGILIALTVITVYTAKEVDLGAFNFFLAMIIASAKATIVALYFMHLKFEDSITWVFAIYPLFLLGLLIGLTSVDIFNRITP
ncbi:MAG TPA: cytochrome C oxidase subunit IV family protein [Thermodesulfobacteriota bacterium]|nr:cytochrome C oxidase subunit IV family protein [Thermodesulfobacteriota bacterium]